VGSSQEKIYAKAKRDCKDNIINDTSDAKLWHVTETRAEIKRDEIDAWDKCCATVGCINRDGEKYNLHNGQ
jgi:hypothetical protein